MRKPTAAYEAIVEAMQTVNTEGILTGFPSHIKDVLHHLEEARLLIRDAPEQLEPTTTPVLQ